MSSNTDLNLHLTKQVFIIYGVVYRVTDAFNKNIQVEAEKEIENRFSTEH
jgi:hypothetical protein